MRTLMAAANWKMNGNKSLVQTFSQHHFPDNGVERVFALPFTLLSDASSQELKNLAAQDVSAYESGAHTGECSAAQLKEIGCEYVIIGHSERRHDHHEDENILIQKWQQLKKQGLKPIYCIGESLSAHDNEQTVEVLKAQLEPIIEANLLDEHCVIAYEPVWAIGTGKAATPDYAQNVHAEIRKVITKKYAKISESLRILYGGSVKPDNAKALIAGEDIDGFLIGGASLDAQSFAKIIEAMS